MNYRLPVSRMTKMMEAGGIREVVNKANALERAGRSVIHLEIGRPDYDSPLCAKEALKRSLDAGEVHYTDTSGTPALRRALADSFQRDRGMDVDPDGELLVTVGAIEGLAAIFLALVEPGDEVIVPTPFFPPYADQIELAGGLLREVPCRFENGFRLDMADLERAVTPRTRMLLINSPNNPSGAVMSREELSEIAALAQKYNFLVVSDECYEKFLYEGEHLSIASLPGMRERTIIVSAASKTFSMTGWRIGWLVLPSAVKPYVTKAHQYLTSCVPPFVQAGVAEALSCAGDDVKAMIEGYKERRDGLIARLQGIEGFEVHLPAGAFYAFPRVEKLTTWFGMTDGEFASWLLEESGVATVPGRAFYANGDFLRMAYCRPLEEVHEAMDRMEEAIQKRLGLDRRM